MATIAIEALLILLLILINGVFAMSEIAILSARKVRLQHRAENGDIGSRTALELANAPGRFLSTIQIGITLVGILAGAFGGATIAKKLDARLELISGLAPYSEAISLMIVVLAITYFSLIAGELVPKRLALNDAEAIAARLARPMHWLSLAAAPAVRLLSSSTESALRVLRVRPNTAPSITEEEIKLMIGQGTEEGVLAEVEQDMVLNVFRLGDRRIHALMTPRHKIVWLDLNHSSCEIERQLCAYPHTRFPVACKSIDHIVGVVRAKDLLPFCLAGRAIDLQTALHRALYVHENLPALKVLEMFKQTGTHMAIVLDEHGVTQGLLTHHDILETLVGSIPSASSPVESPVIRREDGSWLLDGMLPVDEFEQILGRMRIPPEERGHYQTLAGFILRRLGRIPTTGEDFEWGGLRFEILDMDKYRVDRVLMRPRRTHSATTTVKRRSDRRVS